MGFGGSKKTLCHLSPSSNQRAFAEVDTERCVFYFWSFNLCLPNLSFLLENTLWPCLCQTCGLVLILLTDAQHNSNTFDAFEFVLLLRTLHKEIRGKTASSCVRPCFTAAIENAPCLMTVLF